MGVGPSVSGAKAVSEINSKTGLVALFIILPPTTCLHVAWRHSLLAHNRVSSVDLFYTLYLPLPASGYFLSVTVSLYRFMLNSLILFSLDMIKGNASLLSL